MSKICLVCGSENTRKDYDFQKTMRDCCDCGAEWNHDNEVLLNPAEVD